MSSPLNSRSLRLLLGKLAPFLKLGAASGGAALLAFFTQTLLARQLGPDDYGRFSAALSLVTILAPLACFGIGSFWLSVFGKEGWAAERWLGRSVAYVQLSGLFVLALVTLWAVAGPHDSRTTLVILALMIFILSQIAMELVGVLYQLEEKYTSFALWQVLPHVARIALLGLFLVAPLSPDFLHSALTAFFMASAGIIGLGIFMLRRRLGGGLALQGHGNRPAGLATSPVTLAQVIRLSLPFGLVGFTYLVYTQVNVVLVKYLGSDAEAAFYTIAFMVMNAFLLLPNMAFEKILVPRIHRWYHQDLPQLKSVLRLSVLIVVLSSAIGMAVVWLAADYIAAFFFGTDAAPLATALLILMWSIPLRSLSLCFGSVLFVGSFIRLRLWIVLATLFVDVALCVLFIPARGASGAATAMVVAEAVMCILFFLGMRRAIRHGERAV
ncbi:MAG: oligosaccharide flippase family protein [Pannonibacter sp.]